MSSCSKYQHQIESILAGQAGLDAALNRHLTICSDCKALLALHQEWEPFMEPATFPTEASFQAMRERVLLLVSQKTSKLTSQPNLWAPFLLAAAALALGFFAGRVSFEQRSTFESPNPQLASYSNLSYRSLPNGDVIIGYDITTTVERVTTEQDPIIGEILAQTVVGDDPLNRRLEAMNVAGRIIDPKVKHALIYAMRSDGDGAVRLKASSLLSEYDRDHDVRDAFIEVLRHEENARMRIDAMDYLSRFDAGQLEVLMQELETAQPEPLLMPIREPSNQSNMQ